MEDFFFKGLSRKLKFVACSKKHSDETKKICAAQIWDEVQTWLVPLEIVFSVLRFELALN